MMSSYSTPRSLFLPLSGPWVVSCPHVVSLPVPCPYGRLPVTLGPSLPPCRSVPLRTCSPLARALSLPGVVVVEGGGADDPGLGVGGLEPLAEGLGGVGGAEALDRVPEEGLPCRLRHDGLRGGLVGVGGGAGADLPEVVHHVHPFSPSHSPGPLHPAAELRCGVACCLLLCRGALVDVSLAYVLVRSAGWSVAVWRLGGVVRCG